jgi:hypothetical protein
MRYSKQTRARVETSKRRFSPEHLVITESALAMEWSQIDFYIRNLKHLYILNSRSASTDDVDLWKTMYYSGLMDRFRRLAEDRMLVAYWTSDESWRFVNHEDRRKSDRMFSLWYRVFNRLTRRLVSAVEKRFDVHKARLVVA